MAWWSSNRRETNGGADAAIDACAVHDPVSDRGRHRGPGTVSLQVRGRADVRRLAQLFAKLAVTGWRAVLPCRDDPVHRRLQIGRVAVGALSTICLNIYLGGVDWVVGL